MSWMWHTSPVWCNTVLMMLYQDTVNYLVGDYLIVLNQHLQSTDEGKRFQSILKTRKGPCQLDSIHGSVLVLEYLRYQQHLTFTEHLLNSMHHASHSMTIKSFNIPRTKMSITCIMLSFQHISQMWRLKGVSISLTYTASDEGGHNLNFTLLFHTVPHTCPPHTHWSELLWCFQSQMLPLTSN